MIRGLLFTVFLIISVLPAYSFKIYHIRDASTDLKDTYQIKVDTGLTLIGITDLYGLTDYHQIHLRTGFHYNDFGFGFDFRFRFRFINQKGSFIASDWVVENDPAATVIAWLDKIDYIRFADPGKPFYLNTGLIRPFSSGRGLLINQLHNDFYTPAGKQLGLFTILNGYLFGQYKTTPVPFKIQLFALDLLDPDIFGFEFQTDIFRYTRIDRRFSLHTGFVFAGDLNALEKTRLSSNDGTISRGHYRNLFYEGMNTCILGFTLPVEFVWDEEHFRFHGFNEAGLLLNIDNANTRIGFADKLGAQIRVVRIRNSGFLLGISDSFIIKTGPFVPGYFSSNYEIVRTRQFTLPDERFLVYNQLEFSIFALNDQFEFKLGITAPLNAGYFGLKINTGLVLSSLVIPGIIDLSRFFVGVYFENGLGELRTGVYNPNSGSESGGENGGYFIDGITQDFRFSAEFGYHLYATRIRMIFGIQRPSSLELSIDSNNYTIDTGKYAADLQKFISLEVAIAL